MSGPNTNYDPVEVTPLHAEEIERMQAEALDGFATAQDLAALADAKFRHLGDRSPVALANREIGSLPPQARKEAGQRIGAARKAITEAYGTKLAELEAAHEKRMLAEERVDVTLPWHTPRLGARHRHRDRRPGGPGTDLRPRGESQPGHRRGRLPVRIRSGTATDDSHIAIHTLTSSEDSSETADPEGKHVGP